MKIPEDYWKLRDKEQDDKEKESTGQSWLLEQTLPCRRCTDMNQGEEVWKPMSLYSVSQDPAQLWKTVVRKGQDIVCWTCRHQLQWGTSDAVIPCDECGSILPKKNFDADTRARWERLDTQPTLCLPCQGQGQSRKNAELIFCNGSCKTERPEYHYVSSKLAEWIANNDMFSQ